MPNDLQNPSIRFQGFTQDWEKRKLGEIALEVKRKADNDSEAPVMMISASDGFIDQSQRYSNNNAGSSLKNYTLLYEGELAYNHGYSKFRNFGSVFDLKVKEARIPFVYHSFSLPKDDHRFYAYYLNSGLFDGELKKLVSSTARMDGLLNISYEDYMSIPILHPNVQEQEKIGEFLTNLDTIINLHQRKYDKLLNVKKSMLEKMFPKNGESIPQIRFQGFTQDWEKRKLNEFVNYMSSSLTIKDAIEEGLYNLYDANNLIGKTNNEPVDVEYITIIKDGAGVGRIRKLPKNSMFIGTMGALKAKEVDLNFVFSLLTRFNLGDTFSGSTIPHIYFKDYGENKYYVPNQEEQMAIGSFFESLDTLITLQQSKLEKLKNIKKAMLGKMFV